MQQTDPPHADIEADDGISTGDLHEDSSVASLRSSILEHELENGRTYHSMSSGKYQYPNDELMETHVQSGRVPIYQGKTTVVPEKLVIGVDLSPIQPEWTPPNCIFEIDDLEKEWTWAEPFDYIHCRTMEGSFADPPRIIKKIYKALTPGGWFEAGGFVLPMGCDDGTVPKDSALARWHDLLAEAGERCGRSIESPSKYTSAIEEAGFVDIVNKHYVWPLNSWPKDENLKEIGQWQFVNLDLGIEALSMGLLTRVMDWTKEEVYAFCAELRNDLKKKEYHAYWRVHVVYARKPLTEETPEKAPEE
ncbi:methyltransferase domain-containing protein [Colletotrichum salicis]|uniref:Methyltransferase domain-containing protein n=1 Tax=Colletotrichum salicis TaxID=1209931 RepID=A0A135U5A9_9PEZI|nr:methyltransferase domain-containing protein [Colletotrichum salicis]